MKKTAKILSFTLCLCLLISLVAPAASAYGEAADKDTKTYPFVFLHGMAGWSDRDPLYGFMPYWGSALTPLGDCDVMKSLTAEHGNEIYSPALGPFSSAWDSACQLYAQLTGTVTDYGEAHSRQHGHSRYGDDYTGNTLMKEKWNLQDKINLVGYSFGGTTARLFTHLLAYGCEEETAATGEATSPLFLGGHTDCIHSCTSVAAPHNGTQLADILVGIKLPLVLVATLLSFFGSTTINAQGLYPLRLSHFSIGGKNGSKADFSLRNALAFARSSDNCGFNMTLGYMRGFNEKVKTVPSTYYYSYTASATTATGTGDRQKIEDGVSFPIKATSVLMATIENMTVAGIKLQGDWAVSDGVVPVASSRYPSAEKDNAFSYEDTLAKGEDILPGRWYYMKNLENTDHFDFCRSADAPMSLDEFYSDIIKTVNLR